MRIKNSYKKASKIDQFIPSSTVFVKNIGGERGKEE